MKVINTVNEFIELRKTLEGKKIGFVPTMGGLHAGHESLVKRAVKENDITVVSVYLNETQFNDKNDLLTYPANFDDDKALLEKNNVDYLFAPTYSEMYPDDYRYKVTENDLSKTLCGASRPGHFDGVLTVVMKLFNIVRPCNAYFGEKDFQQLELLRGMEDDVGIPGEMELHGFVNIKSVTLRAYDNAGPRWSGLFGRAPGDKGQKGQQQ